MENAELKVGGFTFKGWYVAAALPLLGSLSGGIYYSYDTLQRFYAVEGGIAVVVEESQSFNAKAGQLNTRIQTVESDIGSRIQGLDKELSSTLQTATGSIETSLQTVNSALSARIQTLEQAVIDNDVRGLNAKLAEISTQMQTILAQQKTLLDLRSKVEKSTTITDGLGDKLDIYQQEIDDIWKAYDSLAENPLQ